MSTLSFEPIARSLSTAMREHIATLGRGQDCLRAASTIETNSVLVERRGQPLLKMLHEQGGGSVTGKRLIDLGCGFGALSVFFAAHGADVVGIDPDTALFEVGASVARLHGLKVRLEGGRMERLDVESASCDVAVMNNTLCYLLAPQARLNALSEALRVLRPGGRLVVANPNRWHPIDQFTGLPMLPLLPPNRAATIARVSGRRRPVVRLVAPPRAYRELRHAGFVDVRYAGARAHSPLQRSLARYQHLTARVPAQ